VAELREGRTYYGRVWTEGQYSDVVHPSILNLGVGDGGVSILAILASLRLYGGDVGKVVEAHAPWITADDVAAAVGYYENAGDRAELDERLEQQVPSTSR
jgi:hypothetical protein